MNNQTIELSTQGKIKYFATDATEQQVDNIIKNQNNSDELTKVCLKLGIAPNIDLVGSVAEASHYILSKYVGYLKGYAPRRNKELNHNVQYRDYTQTVEKQLENAWLVKICEDAKTSARTLIKTMHLPYMIIWHIELSSEE